MIRLREWVITALQEVAAHKLRSSLTLTGVALGVLALIVVLSLRVGVTGAIRADFDSLGYDGVLRVSSKPIAARAELSRTYRSHGLRRQDAIFLAQSSDSIAAVAPVMVSSQHVRSPFAIVRGVSVFAVTAEYIKVRGQGVERGRHISAADDRYRAAVCVLGNELAERLFPGGNAVGQVVSIGNHRFTVVGVGARLSSIFIDSEMKTREMGGLYLPLATHALLMGESPLNFNLLVRASDPNRTMDAEAEIMRRLAFAHGGVEDFAVANLGNEILRERAEVLKLLRNWTIVFLAIAAVSLVLGGVGIFSVLQISVAERLYEIGLRKSIGAKDRDIFGQFIIESTVLAGLGALSGSLIAWLVILLTAPYYPAGLSLSPVALGMSNAIAIATGFLAGLYPAGMAARLQPVEALRAA